MGLIYPDAKRLWEARLSGISFENILTCSHLQLFLHPPELEALRQDHRARSKNPPSEPLASYRFGQYADPFWSQFLEAKSVETMDYSEYEGASIVHDLNQPVPPHLHGRYDAVIEAGSLEHIFNFPVAIRNLMQMTKVGGRIFLTTLANNLCGHGFYQFSPELIYRVFSPENGFETTSVVLLEAAFLSVELAPVRAAYQVTDPVNVHSRVQLQNAHPVLMMVDAKRISDVEPFRTTPQQSDYVAAWEKNTTQDPAAGSPLRWPTRVFQALPIQWQNQIKGRREKARFSFRNKDFYRKLF
ncbi:MAG: hypothetical protein ABSF22_03245 [Bryobacteraceae bacterium]|jgi:hypothetical protein